MNFILIWNSNYGNGFIQKDTEFGPFNQVLVKKPNLGFEYIDFEYNQPADRYVNLTDDQKVIVESFISNYEVPEEWLYSQQILQLQSYLYSTDYINSKYIEEVIIFKTKTEEEFLNEYNEMYQNRKEYRENLDKMIL